MECSICFKKIVNSCIGSCTHHFCYICLTHWCYMGGMKCPLCQTPIYEIRLDREFDIINNSPSTPIHNEFLKKITLSFSSIKPGITLVKNRGPGVKIKSLKAIVLSLIFDRLVDLIVSFLHINLFSRRDSED